MSAFWGQRSDDSLQKTAKRCTQSELGSLSSVYWHLKPEITSCKAGENEKRQRRPFTGYFTGTSHTVFASVVHCRPGTGGYFFHGISQYMLWIFLGTTTVLLASGFFCYRHIKTRGKQSLKDIEESAIFKNRSFEVRLLGGDGIIAVWSPWRPIGNWECGLRSSWCALPAGRPGNFAGSGINHTCRYAWKKFDNTWRIQPGQTKDTAPPATSRSKPILIISYLKMSSSSWKTEEKVPEVLEVRSA